MEPEDDDEMPTMASGTATGTAAYLSAATSEAELPDADAVAHADTERLTKSSTLPYRAYQDDHGIVYDTSASTQAVAYSGPLWKHPYLRSHKRLVLGVLLLYGITIGLLVLGFAVLGAGEKDRSPYFFGFSIVTLLPAVYQTVKIYRKLKRNQTYITSEYEDEEEDV